MHNRNTFVNCFSQMPMLFDSLSEGGECFREKKILIAKPTTFKGCVLEGVKRAQYQFIIWKSASGKYPDKPMPDNYGLKRDCDKYISVMMALPPVPRSPSTADKIWICLYGTYLGESAKANHLYCTDLCCCGAEEDQCKIVSEQYAYDF